MRIALCISGQPRDLEQSEVLWKALYVPNSQHQIDTFAWLWSDKSYPADLIEHSIERVLPTRYHVEPQIESLIHECRKYWPRRATIHSMAYAIWQANCLRKEYEAQAGYAYDCVVRLRSDIEYLTPLCFAELPMETDCVYLPRPNGDGYSWGRYCDWFAFGTPRAMDVYSSWYLRMADWTRRGLHAKGEVLGGNDGIPERMLQLVLQEYDLHAVGMIGEIALKRWRITNYPPQWKERIEQWRQIYWDERNVAEWKTARHL